MPKSVLSDRVDLEIPNVFEACIVFCESVQARPPASTLRTPGPQLRGNYAISLARISWWRVRDSSAICL